MKKIKLIMPSLLGLGALASAVPMMSACSKKEYTVHFDTDGADQTISDVVVKEGEKVSEPKEITKNGWIFAGWYKDLGKTKQFDFLNETITSDTTVYAKWVKIGSIVTKDQWNEALGNLANIFTDLYYWTDGSMNVKEYTLSENDETLDYEVTMKNLKFNGKLNSYALNTKEGSLGHSWRIASEYYQNFFFTAYEDVESIYSYDIQYHTQATQVMYNLYLNAYDKISNFKQYGGVYYYVGASDDVQSYVVFNDNLQIQNLYYHEYSKDGTKGTDVTIDLSFYYGETEIKVPEGWDSKKALGFVTLNASPSNWVATKNGWMSTSFIAGYSANDSTKSTEVKKVKFTNDDTGEVISFNDMDVIAYIGLEKLPISQRYIPLIKGTTYVDNVFTYITSEDDLPAGTPVKFLIKGTGTTKVRINYVD